jgi:hypothetical protein
MGDRSRLIVTVPPKIALRHIPQEILAVLSSTAP